MPVHVAVTGKVKPGCERAFQESLRIFFEKSLDDPGVLGADLISPPPGSNSRQYGILRSFVNEQERDEFCRSELFKRWEKRVGQLTEGERTFRELHGLEAWFRRPEPPPQWKMAFLSWLGVWPTSFLLAVSIEQYITDLPTIVSSAITAAAIVIGLTWIIMPLLVKIFSAWLQ